MIDFTNIDYLAKGNELQFRLWTVLNQYQILSKLQFYQPIVVGTIPIDIAIPDSDVDILLYALNPQTIIPYLSESFGNHSSFQMKVEQHQGYETVRCTFDVEGFKFEIFVQPIPTNQQLGYLHMIKEYEILLNHSLEFKQTIIALKKQGIKTEPAFAILLGLEGDPYQSLLEYSLTSG